MQVTDFRIAEGIAGTTVRYPCPRCAQALVSKIGDAGATDTCPNCACEFIVPGEEQKQLLFEDKKRREAQRSQVEAARRKVEDQRRADERARTVAQAASKNATDSKLQLDRDPLKGWYWQFGLLLLMLVVFSGKHMVLAVTTDGTYLCAVIYALFFTGLLVNYLSVRQLRIEYVCAAVCMQKLRVKNGLSEVLAERPAGVFHNHVQDLAQIAKFDHNLTQDCLITLLYSRLMAKSRIIDILAGVLVTLGLVGTILGLIVMTEGLNGTLAALGSDSSSSLLDGMRQTMAGLGTAFYTTLIGAMFGSVVLRILNNVYTSNVDHLVSYVASTAEVKIIPRLKAAARTRSETRV